MEYTCDECYQLRQKTVVKCPLCGRDTFEGRVIGWSSCIRCSNCGIQVSSAGGYPESCHGEKEYRLYIYKPEDNTKLVKLAKYINRNVLELKNQFVDGQITIKDKALDCLEKEKKISELGIICKIDEELEKEFPRIRECPYAYGQYDDWSEFDGEMEAYPKDGKSF